MAIESRETVKLHPPKQHKCKKVSKIITVTPGTATQRLTIQHQPNNISGRGNISYRGLKTTSSCYAYKHTEYIYQTTHMLGGCVPFFVVVACFVCCCCCHNYHQLLWAVVRQCLYATSFEEKSDTCTYNSRSTCSLAKHFITWLNLFICR